MNIIDMFTSYNFNGKIAILRLKIKISAGYRKSKTMRKKTKKISMPVTEHLRYLVEEFLEKSGPDITVKIGGDGDAAKTMWDQLEGILFANTFWMDEVEPEDKADINYEKLIKNYHAILKPVWGSIQRCTF